jgi:hypothetical protein
MPPAPTTAEASPGPFSAVEPGDDESPAAAREAARPSAGPVAVATAAGSTPASGHALLRHARRWLRRGLTLAGVLARRAQAWTQARLPTLRARAGTIGRTGARHAAALSQGGVRATREGIASISTRVAGLRARLAAARAARPSPALPAPVPAAPPKPAAPAAPAPSVIAAAGPGASASAEAGGYRAVATRGTALGVAYTESRRGHTTSVTTKFFVRRAGDADRLVELANCDVPLLDGHEVAVVHAGRANGRAMLPVRFFNASTRETYNLLPGLTALADNRLATLGYVVAAVGGFLTLLATNAGVDGALVWRPTVAVVLFGLALPLLGWVRKRRARKAILRAADSAVRAASAAATPAANA